MPISMVIPCSWQGQVGTLNSKHIHGDAMLTTEQSGNLNSLYIHSDTMLMTFYKNA